MNITTKQTNSYFVIARQLLADQGLLIVEASRSHSVGLLWTSDQSDAETSI